ncbi:MAG TPA: tripartite tricarboxylate transporter substrate-binding protein [Alphaproteobacteria bacterium]|jgi:tripartite-type tricarboxylate transporter receptor subunit TctC|nr:tripartite tricarboxylate transporter substrate-binding protein [Alphaproteobacteria bacterium]
MSAFCRVRMPHCSLMVYSIAASLVGCFTDSAVADPVTDFYSDKQMTLIIGSDIGAGYDAQGRLMARHIGRFIPGNPNIVVQNMPAAGSLAAANHLYNIAPKDGTYFGMMMRNILTAQMTNPSAVRFDVAKFSWIGSLATENGVMIAWHTAPHKTVQDLLTRPLIVGGTTGTDTEISARLLNEFIGTKFKIVAGYKGNNDVELAMERGEVEGMANLSWSNLKNVKADYLKNNEVRILLQNSLEKAPDLPDVPLATDYAKDSQGRQVMELYFSQKLAARPVMAPPGVPADRLKAIREAFLKMAADPKFQADAEKSRLEVNPAGYETVEKVIASITSASPEVTKRFFEATTPQK